MPLSLARVRRFEPNFVILIQRAAYCVRWKHGAHGQSGRRRAFRFSHGRSKGYRSRRRSCEKSRGKILSNGELCSGQPYLIFRDPDGYEVEIAFESSTPVDLGRQSSANSSCLRFEIWLPSLPRLGSDAAKRSYRYSQPSKVRTSSENII